MEEKSILDFVNDGSKTIVIFGASYIGRRVYNYISERFNVKAVFCDNFKKGRESYTGGAIITPKELSEKYRDSYILICVANDVFIGQIKNQLHELLFPKDHIIDYANVVKFIRNESNGGIDWKEAEKTYDWKEHRTQIENMSEWIDENDKSVIDFGAGECYLKNFLRSGVKYIPTDYIARSPEHLVYDFNKDPFPDIHADVCVLNHILYYVNNWKSFLKKVCGAAAKKVILYISVNRSRPRLIKAVEFENVNEIADIAAESGFMLSQSTYTPNKKGNGEIEAGLLFLKI